MPGLVLLPDLPLSDGVVNAVGLLARWAFGTLGLERLELRAQTENAASRAVARRAGFAQADAPVVRRPECDHMTDVYFARLRA